LEVVIEGLEINILEKIKKTKGKDKEVVRVVEEMKKARVKNLRGNEWEIEEELMLKKGKVYIPKDEELRMEIVQLYHNTPVTEYGGRWKMTELVTRNYWWPEVTKDVGKYVEGYDACQRMKNRIEALVGKLMTNEISEKT